MVRLSRICFLAASLFFPGLALAADCTEMKTPFHVGNLKIDPGGRPPFQNGTPESPYGSFSLAYEKAKELKACTIRIKFLEGVYALGEFSSFSTLEVSGANRYKTIVKGGFLGLGGGLSISNLTITGTGSRAIAGRLGFLKVDKVTVKDFSFKPSFLFKAPAAIELINTSGVISGVEVLGGHQPAIRIAGKKATAKVSGLYIKGTRLISGFSYPESPAPPYFPVHAAAIEVSDHAIANFLLTELRDVRYMGIMLFSGAEVYAASLSVNYVAEELKRAQGARFGADAVFAHGAGGLQMNGFRLVSASRSGLMLVASKATLQNGKLVSNTYGVVARNANFDGSEFDIQQCVLNSTVDYFKNETPYLPDGDLPVPNKPMPVPCFDDMPACKGPPPPPSQAPPLPNCPTVKRL